MAIKTIKILDESPERYTLKPNTRCLGRMWDSNAEQINVLFPQVELEKQTECYMIVYVDKKQIECIAVENNVPFDINNVLSRHRTVSIGFVFEGEDDYTKNSEALCFTFAEALKPTDFVPDTPTQLRLFTELVEHAFVSVGWSETEHNELEFKNLAGEVVAQLELSPFVQEQADLAEDDPNEESFVRNKSTKYLQNEGEDGSSPYATQQYVEENGGKIDSISVNGVTQPIDEDKNVDLTIPTQTSDLTNDGDGQSPFATEAYVAENGGKIDSISVNGTAQTIDANKNVDITVPTNTVQTDTQISISGDDANLTNSYVNLETQVSTTNTSAIPLANDDAAGLMSYSDYNQIRENTSRIEALEGKTTRLLYQNTKNATAIAISGTTTLAVGSILKAGSILNGITLSEDTTLNVATNMAVGDSIAAESTLANGSIVNDSNIPSAADINAFVVALGYTSPFEGIGVVTAGTYHIWHYYENAGIGWRDDGLDTVSQFTNEYAGVIKGAAQDGRVYAETDGTGSVYGWTDLKNRVTNIEGNYATSQELAAVEQRVSNNETAITQLTRNKQDNILEFTSAEVLSSMWTSDNTYADYPYKAMVALNNVSATMTPIVSYSLADSLSGNYAPIAETYDGGIYIWSKTNVGITIPSILCVPQGDTDTTYQVYENEAGGLTYVITSSDYRYEINEAGGYTLIIGGQNGSEQNNS